MKLTTLWQSYPPSMKIFFTVYLILPLLAWLDSANLWQIVATSTGLEIFVSCLAYFLAPWFICLFILKRNALVLPALIVQLGSMSFDAMTRQYLSHDFWYFRLVALLVVCVAGVLFTSRDILFPLMATTTRGFRRAPRVYANLPLKLFDHGTPVNVVLENCSLTGIALFGEFHQISNFLRSRYFDDPIFLALGTEYDAPIVRASLVAVRNDQTHIRLGLSIADSNAMSKFIRRLAGHRKDFASKLRLAWNSSYFQRIAIGTWAIAMLGFISIPGLTPVRADVHERSTAMLSPSGTSGLIGELAVEVEGFTTNIGKLRLVLDNSPENYLKQGILIGEAIIRDGKSFYHFKGLPYGEYAVRIFHDENENGELDANVLGIPTEAYGFSNNARRKFGAPSFDESKFKIDSDRKNISINIRSHF